MRISTSSIYNNLISSLQANMDRFSDLNQMLSSGKKINSPSDDPTAMARIMDYKLDISRNENYLENIDDAYSYLNFTYEIIESVSDSLSTVKEIALSAQSGTIPSDEMAALATEVAGMTDFLLDLANSTWQSRYIFSGFMTDTPAFSDTLLYQGDNGAIEVNISALSRIATNIVGTEAFAYTLSAEEVIQLDDGRYIHYIPGAGTSVTVEIRASDDTTVLDTFSYENFMQITELLENALASNDTQRIDALVKPLDDAMNQVIDVVTIIGARLNSLDASKSENEYDTLDLLERLSTTEDAYEEEVTMQIYMAQIALEAMLGSAESITSQSLFDFLD